MNRYRRRVFDLMRDVIQPYAPVARMLDFGAGDGWFAQAFRENKLAKEVVAVDVQPRKQCFVPTQVYDGRHLPFDDRAFELVISIDVLHHCPDPRASLREALRCTDRYFLIKDHTHRGLMGKLMLCILDEVGNRRFGVPSLYHYQRGFEWSSCFEEAGFQLQRLIHPAPCHTGILGWSTNSLQMAALWQRTGERRNL
jgi:SAM-dependent methyltransferase